MYSCLLRLLVGVDHEPLHDRRIDHATDDRDDQPQRGRDDRRPERAGPSDGEVEHRREHRDQDQQHQRRQPGLHDRVRRALHDAGLGVGEFEPVEPVVAGLEHARARASSTAMCVLVAVLTVGTGDTITTPPLRMCAAIVSSSTMMTAANIQSSTNVRNGSWNT